MSSFRYKVFPLDIRFFSVSQDTSILNLFDLVNFPNLWPYVQVVLWWTTKVAPSPTEGLFLHLLGVLAADGSQLCPSSSPALN